MSFSDLVKAGIEHARQRGVKLGRPRTYVDLRRVMLMREAGLTWREIGKRMKISPAVVYKLYQIRVAGMEPLEEIEQVLDHLEEALSKLQYQKERREEWRSIIQAREKLRQVRKLLRFGIVPPVSESRVEESRPVPTSRQ